MIKRILLFSFSLCSLVHFGQSGKPTFKMSDPVSSSSWFFSEFLNVSNGKIYQTGSNNAEFIVKRLDQQTYAEEYDVKVPKKLKNRRSEFHYMETHHGVIDAFFKDFDKEAMKHQLKYRRIDKNGNLSAPRLIDEFEANSRRKGGFWNRFSQDQEKMVVVGYHIYEAEEKQKYTIAVYDWNFNLEWKAIHSLPYTDAEFTLEDLRVTNDGDVIIAGTYSNNADKGITLFKFWKDDFKELLLETQVESLVNIKLKSDILPGKTQFYSWMTRDEQTGYDGYVMLTVDNETFEFTNEVVENFSDNILSNLTFEDRTFGKDRPFLDFEFKDVVSKSDGGFYVISEKNYTEVITTRDSEGNRQESYVYYDLDIVVMSVDNTGGIEFLSLVPKFQKVKSGKNHYVKTSYVYLLDAEDRLHLFYNDNPENLNYRPGGEERPELMKKPVKSAIMQYVIDVDGRGKKNLVKMNEKDFVPDFREYLNLGSEILLTIDVGRKIRYAVLSVD